MLLFFTVKCYFSNKENTELQQEKFIFKLQWWEAHNLLFFLTSGQGWITVTDGTINSALHLQILKENVKTWFVCEGGLERTFVKQWGALTGRPKNI